MSISPTAIDARELDAAAAAAGALGPHEVTRRSAEIPSGDGAPLGADVFHPADLAAGPVLLMRTAYGRGGFSALGIYFASHGYHCVLQDTRGTSSYFHEKSDGASAAAWIARQPWQNGALGLFGTSYMGFTAYATAATRPEGLQAMALSAYSADRVSAWYPGGSFGLDLTLPWAVAQSGPNNAPGGDVARLFTTAADPAFLTLPLSAVDRAFSGQEVAFYQERLRFGRDDPHWAPLDFSYLLEDGTLPPTLLIDGWYDYHRPYLWADFLRLHASRPGDRIVTGPWSHLIDPIRSNLETLAWFDRHLRHMANPAHSTAPVAVHVNPDGGWCELPTWPAPDTQVQHLYLAPHGALHRNPPEQAAGELVDRYTYDPADPTPAVGLASFAMVSDLAQVDNQALEAREDVLIYTSDELDTPLTLLGEVTADLWVTSSTPHTDFYARITDVHPDGRSLAIAQTLRRLNTPELTEPGEPLHIALDLGPVAYRLAAGHRLRLQIASGAHPFYARNLGTGEPIATGTTMITARQAVHYGTTACASGLTARVASIHEACSPSQVGTVMSDATSTATRAPQFGALKFVLHDALDGSLTRTLHLDVQGKSLSSSLLEIELTDQSPGNNA